MTPVLSVALRPCTNSRHKARRRYCWDRQSAWQSVTGPPLTDRGMIALDW
jgi:hypothetical protein